MKLSRGKTISTLAFDVKTLKTRLLIAEAKRWVSFTESGGDNKGQVVEAFQKAVDGRAHGEPWCMSFVQYCLKQVDLTMDAILNKNTAPHVIEKTEHCLTSWYKTTKLAHFEDPKPGRIVIWRHGTSTRGHTGVVIVVDKNSEDIWTVEGNTGPSDSTVQREGDGVYLKRRNRNGTGRMKVVGFLEPWV